MNAQFLRAPLQGQDLGCHIDYAMEIVDGLALLFGFGPCALP
jgi:hypothetical protein